MITPGKKKSFLQKNWYKLIIIIGMALGVATDISVIILVIADELALGQIVSCLIISAFMKILFVATYLIAEYMAERVSELEKRVEELEQESCDKESE